MPVELDIMKPQITTVSKDLSGKKIMIIGGNRTGKSSESVKFPKSLVLAFEMGLEAISGIKFMPINRWADYVKIVRQLCRVDTLEKVKEVYQTIIIDTTEACGRYCEAFVCERFGVLSVAEEIPQVGTKRSPNLYKMFREEFWKQMNALAGAGYTLVFISHDTINKVDGIDKAMARGDKAIHEMIADECGIICHLKANPPDENGNEVLSSAYFKSTPTIQAGSRYSYIVPYLKVFSAENLIKAISDAVQKEEEMKGIKSVTYAEQQETYTTNKNSFESLVANIKTIAGELNKTGKIEEYKTVVEQYLGIGGSVKDAQPSQVQQLELILDDLKDLI